MLNKKLTIIIEKNKENNYNKIDKRKERVKTKNALERKKYEKETNNNHSINNNYSDSNISDTNSKQKTENMK